MMPRQGASSAEVRRPLTAAEMKARQSIKLQEIANALVSAGFLSLDAKAKILGLGRSTTWTLLNGNHKSSGLSARVIGRILAEPSLPADVRAKVLEYIEEKASGRYGHSACRRKKFISALAIVGKNSHAAGLAKRTERDVASTSCEYTKLQSGTSVTEVGQRLGRSRRAS
jgi:hypothetical protein